VRDRLPCLVVPSGVGVQHREIGLDARSVGEIGTQPLDAPDGLFDRRGPELHGGCKLPGRLLSFAPQTCLARELEQARLRLAHECHLRPHRSRHPDGVPGPAKRPHVAELRQLGDRRLCLLENRLRVLLRVGKDQDRNSPIRAQSSTLR